MARVDTQRVAAALTGYEVGAELGHGGFGTVLAARHKLIDRAVAVKVLAEPNLVGDDVRGRFLAEARVLARLDHPHVVRIYDYVEHDGLCLLVMEQLTGGSLRNRATLGVDGRAACAIGLAGATALAAAHEHGVLHRDVKPDNMLFTADGIPKVTDFGIAKILETTSATTTGLVGTPRYMAPEQISGSRLCPGTDLYALAVVLYELLSRRTPFAAATSVPALLHHHLSVPPDPLPEAPQVIAEVVLACLAKDPADRPASAHGLALELARAGTLAFGPDWLAGSTVPVRLPDDVLAAAGHLGSGATPQPGATPVSGAPLGGAVTTTPLPAPQPWSPWNSADTPGTPGTRGPAVPGPPGARGQAGIPPTRVDPDPHPGPHPDPHARGHRPEPGSGSGRRRRLRQRTIVVAVAVFCAAATTAGLLLGLGALGGEDDAETLAAGTAYSGLPVEMAGLSSTEGLAIGPDGTLYVTDMGSGYTGQVLALSPQGSVTRFAGSGPLPSGSPTPSPSPSAVVGNGGPATEADLAGPVAVAVGPDGALFVVEKSEERVRRIERNGIITTYAGVSSSADDGFTGNSGRADKANLSYSDGVAVDAAGNVYVCEYYRVRKVTPDGMISTIAGTGTAGTEGDGGLAVNATVNDPTGIAVADDGTVYVADTAAHTIRRILPGGRIEHFAGTNDEYGYAGDGNKATDALLYAPEGLAIGPDGSVYVADSGNGAIRKITPNGIITTVAGNPDSSEDADGIRATEAKIYSPTGVAVDETGAIYIAQSSYAMVRRVGTDGILTTVLRAPE